MLRISLFFIMGNRGIRKSRHKPSFACDIYSVRFFFCIRKWILFEILSCPVEIHFFISLGIICICAFKRIRHSLHCWSIYAANGCKSSPFRFFHVNKQQINLSSFAEKQHRNHADFTVPLTANIRKVSHVDLTFNIYQELDHFSWASDLITLVSTTPYINYGKLRWANVEVGK